MIAERGERRINKDIERRAEGECQPVWNKKNMLGTYLTGSTENTLQPLTKLIENGMKIKMKVM